MINVITTKLVICSRYILCKHRHHANSRFVNLSLNQEEIMLCLKKKTRTYPQYVKYTLKLQRKKR